MVNPAKAPSTRSSGKSTKERRSRPRLITYVITFARFRSHGRTSAVKLKLGRKTRLAPKDAKSQVTHHDYHDYCQNNDQFDLLSTNHAICATWSWQLITLQESRLVPTVTRSSPR
jgi:hypothetical protein